jgi:hypothetical protein
VTQRRLGGCAFCDAGPTAVAGTAFTWGVDERLAFDICRDCALQATPDPDDAGHHACDGCGVVVDTGAALAHVRVRVGRLEGTIRLCERCCPDGPASYWTRALDEHRVG